MTPIIQPMPVRGLDGHQNLNLKPSLNLKRCKPLTLDDKKLKPRIKIYQNTTASFYTKNSTPGQHSRPALQRAIEPQAVPGTHTNVSKSAIRSYSVSLSVRRQSVRQLVCQSVRQSASCLTVCQSVCPSACLSVCLSIYLSVCLSICLSVSQPPV